MQIVFLIFDDTYDYFLNGVEYLIKKLKYITLSQ